MYAITVVFLISMQLMFTNLIVHSVCDYEYKTVRCIMVNIISIIILCNAIVADLGLWCLIIANVISFAIFAFSMSAESKESVKDPDRSTIEYNKDDFIYMVKTYIISVLISLVVMLVITSGSDELIWYFDRKSLVGMCVYSILIYGSYKIYSVMLEYNKYVIGYMVLITIYTFVVLMIIKYYGEKSDVVVLAVLFIYVILVVAMEQMSKRQIQNMENDILNNQKEFYAEQMEVVDEAERKARAIRHDMKNHLNVIESLLKGNRNKEALEYIETMRNDINESANKINTGNFEIDAVINNKVCIMRKHNILLKQNLIIPKGMEFEPYDMVIIIGNLLDNAIDNTINNMSDKTAVNTISGGGNIINLTMRYNKGMLKITVVNSCINTGVNKTFEYHNKRILSDIMTTKKDKKNHGYGLKNVYRIAEKYNGSMTVRKEPDRFVVEVVVIE